MYFILVIAAILIGYKFIRYQYILNSNIPKELEEKYKDL